MVKSLSNYNQHVIDVRKVTRFPQKLVNSAKLSDKMQEIGETSISAFIALSVAQICVNTSVYDIVKLYL